MNAIRGAELVTAMRTAMNEIVDGNKRDAICKVGDLSFRRPDGSDGKVTIHVVAANEVVTVHAATPPPIPVVEPVVEKKSKGKKK